MATTFSFLLGLWAGGTVGFITGGLCATGKRGAKKRRVKR